MVQERMVVLANSKKLGGYCIAGKVLDNVGHVGSWMRPITATVEDGLPMHRILCNDGLQAAILDVVTQDWGPAAPALHQHENRLMGMTTLQRCGRVSWEDIPSLADHVTSTLWKNGESSRCGLNDRVSATLLPYLSGSLLLVYTYDLLIYRITAYEGKIKYRADFSIGTQHYNLALTDGVAISWLANNRCLALPDAFVCISLAVPFVDGFAYKLVAAVITKQRAEISI